MKVKSAAMAVMGLLAFAMAAATAIGQETFTGNIISYGSGMSTRTRTSTFTLRVNRTTPETEAKRYLGILQDDGQSGLLSAIRNEDLGSLSIGSRLGQRINAVRESIVDGERRIYIIFERWMQFAEIRGGYRSTDYPFGYLELRLDPRTGRGDGTYIAAATIRWKGNDPKLGPHVEVEDFATFPAKVVNVRSQVRSR